MNILVTGGAGFIGSELSKFLIKNGHKVIILDNLEYGYLDNIKSEKKLLNNFIKNLDAKNNLFKIHSKNILHKMSYINTKPVNFTINSGKMVINLINNYKI